MVYKNAGGERSGMLLPPETMDLATLDADIDFTKKQIARYEETIGKMTSAGSENVSPEELESMRDDLVQLRRKLKTSQEVRLTMVEKPEQK